MGYIVFLDKNHIQNYITFKLIENKNESQP